MKALAIAGHTVDIISADTKASDLSHVPELFNLPGEVRVIGGAAPRRRGLIGKIPRRIRPTAIEPGLSLPDLVIVFDPNPMTFRDVNRYCRKNGTPLVLDIDEWMGPRDFSFASWLTLFPLRYELFIRRLPHKVSYAFAISKAMQSHIASAGAKTLLVPPLHDHKVAEIFESDRADRTQRTRVVVPGVRKASLGKDRESLELVTSALIEYPELQKLVQIEVVGGVDDPSATAHLAKLSQSACVRNHGKLEWSQMISLVGNSDWLVALRDPSVRRLKYGFPSKVTEALVLGTPVLANDYSDMNTVLSKPKFGKVVEELSTEVVARSLLEISRERRDRAKVSRSALQSFTPQGVSSSIEAFVKKVKL